MAAAYKPIPQTMMASSPVVIVTNASATRAILFAISFTPVAIHFPIPPIICIKTTSLTFDVII
jgi:hypothetical protein